METRVRVIQELVRDSIYAVDERVVAEAIMARAKVRMTVASSSFRSENHGAQIRSLRRDRDGRSFRLIGGPRLRLRHWT